MQERAQRAGPLRLERGAGGAARRDRLRRVPEPARLRDLQPEPGRRRRAGFGSAVYSSQLLAILAKYIPVPAAFAAKGITRGAVLPEHLATTSARTARSSPDDFVGYTINYQPAMMATEIDQRVVQPTLAAGMLFDKFPYLTRLYTTLSPEDMNKDPVFCFNPGLTDFSNMHNGDPDLSLRLLRPRQPAHHAGDAARPPRAG